MSLRERYALDINRGSAGKAEQRGMRQQEALQAGIVIVIPLVQRIHIGDVDFMGWCCLSGLFL